MEIETQLIQFIGNKLLVNQELSNLAPGDPLLNGLLDSVNILRLVVFIEEQYQIQVLDDELVPENFQNVQRIADYIRGKSASAAKSAR